MGKIFSKDDNKEKNDEETIKTILNTPQDNIITENNPLAPSQMEETNVNLLKTKREREREKGGGEEDEEKNKNSKKSQKSIEEKNKKSVKDEKEEKKIPNLNVVNVQGFSFNPYNNTQNTIELKEQNEKEEKKNVIKKIEEEKQKINEILMKLEEIQQKLKVEIDEGIFDINKIKDKNELRKTIQTKIKNSIIQDKDVEKMKTIYQSLNPKVQESLQDNLKKFEDFLTEETVLKTEITKNENENEKNKKIDSNNIKNSKELFKKNSNFNEIKSAINNNNIKNINDHKDDNLNNNNNINTFNNNMKSNSVKMENNNLTLKDFNNYSFKCLTQNLNFTMVKGTNEVIYKLVFENNGEFPWPKNKSILSTNKSNSNIKIQDILLDAVNPRCQYTFDIKFRNMNRLPVGKYYSYLDFIVDGKRYGNSILINVEIIESNKAQNNPIINEVKD